MTMISDSQLTISSTDQSQLSSLLSDFSFFIHQPPDRIDLIDRTCSVCLQLLTRVPSAREAIFDYLNTILNISVHCYIQKEVVVATSVTDLLIQIESKLTSLAKQTNAWANILAQWSIDQLYHMTMRYSTEQSVKDCKTREDRINLWTSCQATMTLIKIASACILNDSVAADNAINKFLEASILSRPAFEWVTVSLSLRCGHLLISRLINLSLEEISQPHYVRNVPRIFAVWSSLEVIAEQEPQLFNQALMEQIQNLLQSTEFSKQTNISALIKMTAVVTDPLCDLVYYSLYKCLNTLTLRKLCAKMKQGMNTEQIDTLAKEFISGLMRIRTDSFHILQFIINLIGADDDVEQQRDTDEIELTLR
ncbi:unnamed protein product, partial [Didymodactylos carnosus]